MNKVEIIFKEKAITRYGITLYSKEDTLDFILKCKDYGIIILGIDAFFISDIATEPSLENSIDYSITMSNGDIYEKALEFINKRNEDLYFEIVCE